MLKGLVCFMAELAFVIGKTSEINRMLEGSGSHILLGRSSGIVDHRVADVAIIPDHFARIAYVLTIVAAKATR